MPDKDQVNKGFIVVHNSVPSWPGNLVTRKMQPITQYLQSGGRAQENWNQDKNIKIHLQGPPPPTDSTSTHQQLEPRHMNLCDIV